MLLARHDPHCVERISTTLDRMDPESRLMTVLSIEPAEQRVLWDLMEGHAVSAEHFVPSSTEPLQPVIHHGRNTLPAFKFFQKRFYRLPEEEQVAGFNAQALGWLTGPGYFVAKPASEGPSDFVIDYTELPKQKPDTCPPIQDNTRGVSRWVYGGMKDYVRGVSEHVCIGRAFRAEKALDAWFVLCRADAS